MFYEDLTMNPTILFPFLSTNTGNEKQSNDNWFFDTNFSSKNLNANTKKILRMRKKKRSTKLCTACPHKFAVHYAKNMCSNCYHAKGRSKRPWKCPHVSKAHYALGLSELLSNELYKEAKRTRNKVCI